MILLDETPALVSIESAYVVSVILISERRQLPAGQPSWAFELPKLRILPIKVYAVEPIGGNELHDILSQEVSVGHRYSLSKYHISGGVRREIPAAKAKNTFHTV